MCNSCTEGDDDSNIKSLKKKRDRKRAGVESIGTEREMRRCSQETGGKHEVGGSWRERIREERSSDTAAALWFRCSRRAEIQGRETERDSKHGERETKEKERKMWHNQEGEMFWQENRGGQKLTENRRKKKNSRAAAGGEKQQEVQTFWWSYRCFFLEGRMENYRYVLTAYSSSHHLFSHLSDCRGGDRSAANIRLPLHQTAGEPSHLSDHCACCFIWHFHDDVWGTVCHREDREDRYEADSNSGEARKGEAGHVAWLRLSGREKAGQQMKTHKKEIW